MGPTGKEGGNKRAGFCCLGEGITQQTGLSAGSNVRLNEFEIFGPIPNRSSSPIGQREGSGLKKAPKLKQVHKSSVGADRLDGLTGPVSTGPKQAGPLNGPRILKAGVRGNKGLEKALNVARVGPKGVTYCSKVEERLGDGGSRLGAGFSLGSLADPAWICARDSLLNAHEGRPSLGGTSGFESCWEEGLGVVSPDCPLMGFSHQVQGEEGCTAARSFAQWKRYPGVLRRMTSELSESMRKAPGLKLCHRMIFLLQFSLFLAGLYFPGALQAWGISMSMRPWGRWNR